MRKQAYIVLLSTFATVCLVNDSIGQADLGSDTIPGAHAITLGLEARDNWRNACLSYEWLLGKRLVPNVTIGTGLNKLAIDRRRAQGGLVWRYAGSLQFKYIFLLNKEHPLGGFYTLFHLGYHRQSFRIEQGNYLQFKSNRAEVGPGLGFQWVFAGRIMAGASGIITWTSGEDWRGNPDGSTLSIDRRSSFMFIRNVRLGIAF